jgi:tetratricopeptide (TPR) repeat protein
VNPTCAEESSAFEKKVLKNGITLHIFKLKSVSEIEAAHFYYFHTNPIIYLFFVPGVIVFLALFLKRKSAHASQILIILSLFFLLSAASTDFPKETIENGINAFKAADYTKALESFNLSLKKERWNPALFYNKALSHYLLNQKGMALYSLRQGLRANPQDLQIQKVLTDIENELGLQFQVSPAQFLHPNFSFVALILLVNFSLLTLGLVFRFHNGTLFIVFVFFAFAFFSIMVIFVSSLVQIGEQTGVLIVKEGTLKKIPLDKAQAWLHLKEGTSLKINGFAQGYALVKTGLGFEGWIKKENLIYD